MVTYIILGVPYYNYSTIKLPALHPGLSQAERALFRFF